MIWVPKKPDLIIPEGPRLCTMFMAPMDGIGFGAGGGGAVPYRYFKFDFTDQIAYNENRVGAITDLRIKVGSTTYPPNMEADSASGYTLTGSGADLGDDLHHAVDASPVTTWQDTGAPGCWWSIDFGAGNEIIPTSYTLMCRYGNPSLNRCPKDWTFEGSNTGVFSGEEEILHQVTARAAWVQNTTYEYFI